jgi:hypothetical protein
MWKNKRRNHSLSVLLTLAGAGLLLFWSRSSVSDFMRYMRMRRM